MWTSEVWFFWPSFETKSCTVRPTVTRDHKLHGRHETSPTNLQVKQYNMLRGGEIFKARGMQRRLANAVSYLGFEQPTSRHLVQPIAWRRPDRGLNPQRRVPKRARRRAPRRREWYPYRGLSTAATIMWTSKVWLNRPPFGKNRVPPAQPVHEITSYTEDTRNSTT